MTTRAHVLRITHGYVETQVVLTAHALGVFESLRAAPLASSELAARIDAPAGALERLLIACCALELVSRDGERYALTEAARNHLLEGAPEYIGYQFGLIREFYYPLMNHLLEGIREDRAQWSKLPAMKQDYYSSVYKDEIRLRAFMQAMFGLTHEAAREAAERFDFSRFQRIADLGGAPGAFLVAVCQRNPAVTGTIFDLPPVEQISNEMIARAGLQDRIRFASGDFFRDPLPPANLYAIGYVLHNWSRERGVGLLRKIHQALPHDGAVFIGEALFDRDKTGPFWTARSNLVMLLASDGGQERTPAEYDGVLREAGFARTEHQYCTTPKSFVVGWKT